MTIRGRRNLLCDLAEGRVAPTSLGIAISRNLQSLPSRYPGVKLCAKQIMPDHIHLVVHCDSSHNIREIMRGVRLGAVRLAQNEGIDTEDGQLFDEPFIRTLAHPGQLKRMIEYVHDNPRRAILRQQHPDLFSLRRNIAIPTEEGISLTFSSMGNLFLADYPIKQTVICSRSLQADQISAICQEALYRAEEGTVTITGAISEGERTIARAIREAGWPLIVLLTNGFPAEGTDEARHYKPGGVYFDACCEGRLLLLEPTNEALEQEEVVSRTDEALRLKAEDRGNAYTPLPHDTQRWHYMAVNTIAQLMGK